MYKRQLWGHDKGKTKLELADTKFLLEKKLMMENRLGIAMALLKTMQFLHDNERLHCDLHFANILLHFNYEEDRPTKIYVRICNFGLSKAFSQCLLKEHRIFTTLPVDIKAIRKQYPQLAPELVRENPAMYNKDTDVYMMGNIFETLLTVDDGWDGMGCRVQHDTCNLVGSLKEMALD